jgi:YVTN family beta-propeller protein/autotransporter-associated beta strand protein
MNHHKLTGSLLVVAALIVCAPERARAQITSRLVVPSQGSNTFTVIDTATNTIVGAPSIGFGAVDAAALPDGRGALLTVNNVVGFFSFDPLAAGGIYQNAGTSPFGVAVSPDARKAYMAATNGVAILDLTTIQPAGLIATPGSDPIGVVFTPDGTRAYVASFSSNEVLVIDVATDTLIGSPIAVGNGPQGLAVTPDGSTLYVVNSNDDTVSVIVAGAVVTTIPVGGTPWAVAVTPDGTMAYVTNSFDGTVSVIDVATNTVSTTIPIVSSCGCAAAPTGIAFTPNGQFAYVLSASTDEVTTIDVATATQTSTFIPVGTAPAAIGALMGPNLIVPTGGPSPVITTGDADMTAQGFGKFVVFNGGLLQLAADWTTARTISMLGTGGTLDTQGFDATINGGIRGLGMLTKIGTGRLTLSGTDNDGNVHVSAGTLELDGTTGFVSMTAGTVTGTGTASTLLASGGTISPGVGGPGILHAAGMTLNQATTVAIQLNGPTAGIGYDQLDASISQNLGSATLNLQLGYVPAPGTTFVIATHTTGMFNGLPEGAFFVAGGRHFRITYQGGVSGADAMLLADEPPAISGLGDRTVPASSVLGPITFTVSDDRTAAAALVVTATSSNTFLLPNDNLVLGGSGGSRTLTATPSLGASGTAQITVNVFDGFQTTTVIFTLTVTPLPTYYLAEGATGPFFDTDVLLANPNSTPAPITLTFFRDDATTLIQHRTLPATSRTTIHAKDIDGLDANAFSTAVTSNLGLPLVVERTMWWDASGYGSHGEKASDGPAPQWYFAEGSQGFFHTYFLLLNLHETPNTAHITYFLEDGSPVMRDYAMAPTSRLTVDVATEPALANRSFGALVTFDQPGMAERAMYFGTSPTFSGGHDSAGVTAPATSWFLAEGATGSFFDTFVLIANPGDLDTTVTMTYLPATGSPIVKTHAIAAHQRLTVNIADEDPALASAAVGTQITATQPVVVERSVYWPHGNWYEAHNTTGETSAGLKWGLAEGRVGGTNQAQTYILLANPGTQAAVVTATFLRTNGTTLVKTFTVAPSSRLNIAVTGAGSDVPELADESFGATLISTQPIIVERSLYTDANGVTWAAGTNATATRLP